MKANGHNEVANYKITYLESVLISAEFYLPKEKIEEMVTVLDGVGDTVLHTYIRNRFGMATRFRELAWIGRGIYTGTYPDNYALLLRLAERCDTIYHSDISFLLKINKGLAAIDSKHDKMAPFMLAAVVGANTSTIFVLFRAFTEIWQI
jgi:hypothetical protein